MDGGDDAVLAVREAVVVIWCCLDARMMVDEDGGDGGR